jgi:hypothetical protein
VMKERKTRALGPRRMMDRIKRLHGQTIGLVVIFVDSLSG